MTTSRRRVDTSTIAVVAGDFDAGPRGRDEARAWLLARGALVREVIDDACTLVVVGAVTRRLGSLLGASTLEREVAARAARGQPIVCVDEDELRTDPSPRHKDGRSVPPANPQTDLAAQVAVARGRGDDALHAARIVLARDSAAAAGQRAAVCDALEKRADGDALDVLASAIVPRAPFAELPAGALGRLVARGLARWDVRPAPFAIELRTRGRKGGEDPALGLARSLGATETLADEDGHAILRVTPSTARGPIVRPALFELLDVARRRAGRVWLGGLALRATLESRVLYAAIEPLAHRH